MSLETIHRLDALARRLAPAATTILIVLVSVVPLHLPYYARVPVQLALMPLYHWALHRPEVMPPASVFGIGLLADVLTGAPLGVNAFVFLICYGTAVGQRRFLVGEPFPVQWLGFVLMAGLAGLLQWLACSVYAAALMPVRPLFFQSLLTVALYPVVAWTCVQMQRALLSAR